MSDATLDGRDLPLERSAGSAIRERNEELLRKFLAAVRTAEPRVDPNEELLRELLEALRTLRARTARPGDSAVAEGASEGRVRELGDRALAAHRAGADVAGLREASAKFERAARAASEEILRRLRSLRPWRPWLAAPAAACVLFLGALAQRKSGDGLRHDWNAYVAERRASPLACCAAKAKLGGGAVVFRLTVMPPADVAAPFRPAVARPPGNPGAER